MSMDNKKIWYLDGKISKEHEKITISYAIVTKKDANTIRQMMNEIYK